MTGPSGGKLVGMLASLTGLGRAAAAGRPAYIPRRRGGLQARSTDDRPQPFGRELRQEDGTERAEE